MNLQIPFAPDLSLTRKILTGARVFAGKGLARTVIARTIIEGGRVLSVPIVGGSGILKRQDINLDKVLISNHGRWRQEHLGAMNAVYGKTPYFPYIFPVIENIYHKKSNGSLGEFNRELFDFVCRFLDVNIIRRAMVDMKSRNPYRFEQMKREFETKVNLNYSIFDTLFRLGKNTVFVIFDD